MCLFSAKIVPTQHAIWKIAVWYEAVGFLTFTELFQRVDVVCRKEVIFLETTIPSDENQLKEVIAASEGARKSTNRRACWRTLQE